MRPEADKLLDGITADIVELLIENPTVHYNKSQIARHAEISREALYDRLDALLAYGILQEADDDLKRTHYTLNPDAPATDAFAQLLYLEGDSGEG
jgi:DNA-binding Lrp family transcriptional regulator